MLRSRSINLPPRWSNARFSNRAVHHFSSIFKFLSIWRNGSPLRHVRLQPFVKVVRTQARIENCHQQQDDGQHGERGELFSGRGIKRSSTSRIHPEHLEDEVGKTAEVENLFRG